METEIAELQKWLHEEQHLPRIEPLLLQRFLNTCFGNIDETKQLIEYNYSLRNKNSGIFLKRDPCDKNSQQVLEVADLIPLPGLAPDKSKILLYRLIDYDVEKYFFTEGVKVYFMLADCRFAIKDPAGMDFGEIPLFDMAGFSLRHLTKVVISSLRVYMKFVQEAHPIRLKEIHLLNCPTYLDKVLMVVKPFIKTEVYKLIKFHYPDSTTLYDHIPREMLPKEYGGNAGPIADLKAKWVEILKEKRDYLMDESYWKIDNSKKRSKASSTNYMEKLRNLEID